MAKTWAFSGAETGGKYLGLVEFEDTSGEYHTFEVMQTPERLVFGGACNIGFLESGYMPIDDCYSLDENLATMVDELKIFYNYGANFTEFIICNARM